MKLLLVLGDDDTYKTLKRYIKPLGFDFVRYNHILKAMDNVDEVDPDGIIISARDFPRHWKIMAKFIRGERPKELCPLIILKGKDFSTDDASKASFLGVSAIVSELLDDFSEVSHLQAILGRYTPIKEKRRSRRLHTEPRHKFGFVCIRSGVRRTLITGTIKNISAGGMMFQPDDSSAIVQLLQDVMTSTELNDCSLRAGDSILSPVCRVLRIDRNIAFSFSSFPDGEQEILNSYITSLSR